MKNLGRYSPAGYIENMEVLYCPVAMKGEIIIPNNLYCFYDIIVAAINNEGLDKYKYIYVSASAGLVQAGTAQRREGWHVDSYGCDDENYVWSSTYPTEYVDPEGYGETDLRCLGLNHAEALKLFEILGTGGQVKQLKPQHLYKLEDLLHRTPVLKETGYRVFVKISFSNEKYNLKGNAINYGFNTKWAYYDRKKVRNHPVYSNSDFYKEG